MAIKSKKILIISFLIFIFFSPFFTKASSNSVPNFPMALWGNISVDGKNAPIGTIINAYYGSTLAGQATTSELGIYGYNSPFKNKLLIGQGDGSITFKFIVPGINNNKEFSPVDSISLPQFVSGQTMVFNFPVVFKAAPLQTTTVVNSATSTVVIGNNPPASAVINIPQNVSTTTLNASVNATTTLTSTITTLPSQITVNASTSLGNFQLQLPANLNITATTTNWDGNITLPQIKTGSQPIVPDTGNSVTSQTAIEIGLGDIPLFFDQAVKLIFSGQAGRDVGFVRGGVFTKITVTCDANTQAAGNAKADCKINSGSDLVVWTKHFTTFVVYTQTQNQTTSSSGGGGGGGSPIVPTPTPTPTSTPTSTTSLNTLSGAHTDGTLILDGKAVYIISNGKRQGFRNAEEYKSYGFSFTDMVAANNADKALLEGDILKAMDGTLVLDTSDNRTVYIIGSGGVKRGFSSEKVFKTLGYKYSQAVKINLSDYPTGEPIISSTNAHPNGTLVKDGKTIWWINAGKRYGFPSMTVFNSYGWSLTKLVPANTEDLKLPQGDVLIARTDAMKSGKWLK